MKTVLLAISGVVLTACSSFKTISLQEIVKAQPQSETLEIISQLASDKFQGREPGTEGYESTLSYVESLLRKNKIKPYFKDSYRDTMTINGAVSANIVAVIGNQDPARKTILIGAHLDHLGLSRNSPDSIYNGANDNASGVTAVLQVAKVLNNFSFDQNIIVALFTGEESGLLGSKHLAERLKKENLNLAYMLNFEMIGKTLTTGSNQVYITGFSKSDCAAKMNVIVSTEFVKYLPAEIQYSLFSRSDNFAFYQKFGVPSHTISTFDFQNYDYYHQESDEVKLLDIDNMNRVINTATFIISQLLRNDVELTNVNPPKKKDF